MGAEYPPRARATIHQPDQIRELRIPEIDEGCWAEYVDWWQTMTQLARETKVTFNGQPGSVAVAPLGIQWIGPYMMAIDLVGDDFYWWMLECPEACHQSLHNITSGRIHPENRFCGIDPHAPGPNFALAEDSAESCRRNYSGNSAFRTTTGCMTLLAPLCAMGGECICAGKATTCIRS